MLSPIITNELEIKTNKNIEWGYNGKDQENKENNS